MWKPVSGGTKKQGVSQITSWLMVLALALALGGLAGCGGGGDGGASGGDTTKGTPYVLVAADANGDIFLIDKTSGATMLALDVWTDDGQGNRIDIGPIGAMTYDAANGRVFAVLESGSNVGCDYCTYTIDPATGKATLLNDLDIYQGVGDVALRASDGKLLMSWNPEGASIAEVEISDGSTVADFWPNNGSYCCGGFGLDFASDGSLYMVTTWSPNIKLFKVDPANLFENTFVSNLDPILFPVTLNSFAEINSMASSPDGKIWGIMNDNGAATYLATVEPDPNDLTITYRATLASFMDGLTTVPLPGTAALLAADDTGDIYSINPASGAITKVKDVWADDGSGGQVDVGPISGMAFSPNTGRLLAVTDSRSTTCANCIFAIDPATGRATIINNELITASWENFGDIAWSYTERAAVFSFATDGTVYGNIDPVTGGIYGDGIDLGNSCCNFGMAFANDGTLYLTASSGQKLYSLDPTANFFETLIGNYTYSGFVTPPSGSEYINSMTMGADGNLYAIMIDGAKTHLVVVDPAAGAPVVTWKANLSKPLDGLVALTSLVWKSVPLTQFGRIGGYDFKVVEGVISQSGPDQPISTVGGPATIIFDKPIANLSTIANQVNMHATGTVSDGGSMTAFAFGQITGSFVNGFATGIERSGADFNYRFQYLEGGIFTSDSDILSTPANPDGDVHLGVDFSNDGLGGIAIGSGLWDIESAPIGCTFTIQAGTPDPGNTDRIGIRIQDAILKTMILNDPVFGGC